MSATPLGARTKRIETSTSSVAIVDEDAYGANSNAEEMMKTWLLTIFVLMATACSGPRAPGPNADTRTPDNSGRSCETGNAAECMRLGYAKMVDNKATAESLPYFKKACELENGKGCNEYAWAVDNGWGKDSDPAEAAGYYTRGCEFGDIYACSNLGYAYDNGRGVEKSQAKAVEYYEMACNEERALPNACFNLGIMYERARGVQRDDRVARSHYEKACSHEKKIVGACTNLGVFLLNGRGGPADYPRALELLKYGCAEKNGYACGSLGYMYGRGVGVDEDDCRARELYEESCAIKSNPVGCANLGDFLVRGICGTKDVERALGLLKTSCDSTNPHGCGSLGELYETGEGVEKDLERAVASYERGCDSQDAYACHRLAKAHQTGIHVPIDRTRAIEVYRRACTFGRPASCDAGLELAQGQDREFFVERVCTLGLDSCPR